MDSQQVALMQCYNVAAELELIRFPTYDMKMYSFCFRSKQRQRGNADSSLLGTSTVWIVQLRDSLILDVATL